MDWNSIKEFDYQAKLDQVHHALYFSYGRFRRYLQPYVSTDFRIDQITERLYIGDLASACNREALLKTGITHVVTAISGVDPIFPDDFHYKNIDICDHVNADLYKDFDQCADFIDQAIKGGGKVYVHCICGISRSATIISAYLINKWGYTDIEAIQLIKNARHCINPNEGFRQQLSKYYNTQRQNPSPDLEKGEASVNKISKVLL